jgi:hypothetical protein
MRAAPKTPEECTSRRPGMRALTEWIDGVNGPRSSHPLAPTEGFALVRAAVARHASRRRAPASALVTGFAHFADIAPTPGTQEE